MARTSSVGRTHARRATFALIALVAGCYAPSERDDFKAYDGATVPSGEADDDGSDDDGTSDDATGDTARGDAASRSPQAAKDGGRDAAVQARDAGGGRVPEASLPQPEPTQPVVDPVPVEESPAPVAPAPSTQAPTKLSFSVQTVTVRGTYAPRNVGAIWIENAAGTYVKTLAKWAGIRQRHLTGFVAASGGNAVDAVTGATLRQHAQHSVTWNLTDVSGKVVPNGEYKVRVEMTESTRGTSTATVAFTKGDAPAQQTAPDQAGLSNMSLRLE